MKNAITNNPMNLVQWVYCRIKS